MTSHQSEDMYERTLTAYHKDLDQLHAIERKRQEINYRIREHQNILKSIKSLSNQSLETMDINPNQSVDEQVPISYHQHNHKVGEGYATMPQTTQNQVAY